MDEQDVACALNNLGVCHKHASDFEKAVGVYEEAFKLCPTMPNLRGNLDRCREMLLQTRFKESMSQSPAPASVEASAAIALSQAQKARVTEVQQCESAWPPMGMPIPIPSNSPGGAIQGGFARVRGLSSKPVRFTDDELDDEADDEAEGSDDDDARSTMSAGSGSSRGGKGSRSQRKCPMKNKRELNGVEGRLTHYVMEKGRFAFQPITGGASISVRPHNLEPLDRYPDPLCNVTSTAFCAKLQESLVTAGDHRRVIDLTPHVMGFKSMLSAFVWVVNRHDALFRGSDSSLFSRSLFYVQRCKATDPFFLFVRELTMSANQHAPAPPFMVIREEGEGLVVPPTGGHHLEMESMLRFCLSVLTPTWTCPVCLGDFKNGPEHTVDFPQTFGCGHFICQLCLGGLYPAGSLGITCPVCRSFAASLGTRTPDWRCKKGAAQIYERT